MRRAMIAGTAALVVVALAVTLGPALWAQGSGPPVLREPLILQGPGSVIGVTIRELRADEASNAQGAGVAIETVREGSPAARANFRPGDVVIQFDGERVRSVRTFSRLVAETPPGRTVEAVVVRAGSRQTLRVTPEAGGRASIDLPDFTQLDRGLRALPRDFNFDFAFPPEAMTIFRGARLGMTLSPLSDQLATFFGVQGGALVSSVQDGSVAAQAGVRAGDVITAVNGRTVNNVGDATAAAREAAPGSTVEIRVMREKRELTLRAMVPEQPGFNRRPPGNQVPI